MVPEGVTADASPMVKHSPVTVLALLIAAMVGTVLPAPASAASVTSGFAAAGQAAAVMAVTNLDRQALGLPALAVDPYLASLARNGSWTCPGKTTAMAGRAQDMLTRGYFDHTPTGCAATILPVLINGGYGADGENIGWNNWPTGAASYATGCDNTGANCAGTVDGVPQNVAVLQRAWMNSAAHRANILGKWDRIGCGLATAATWQGYTNAILAVCLFANGATRVIDDDAPAFTAPVGGGVYNAGDTIHAAVSTTDASGLASATLLMDGAPVYTWTFDAPLTSGRLAIDIPTANLTAGMHVMTWQASDLALQQGEFPVSLSIGQTTSPTLAVAFATANTSAANAVADGGAKISWTETAPDGLQLSRVLTSYKAPMGTNGSCTGVAWTAVQTLNPVTTAAVFDHVAANTCYRWHVEVSALGVTAMADSASLVDGRPSAAFTTPRPNLIINSPASGVVTWTESNPSHMAYTRTLEIWSGLVVTPGNCSGVAWTLASATSPTTTSVKVAFAKRTCYRFRLALTTATGASVADSGWYLVGIPVVTFTNPTLGTIAKAAASTYKVRWAIANPTNKAITSRTLKVYWTTKTAAACGTSWHLMATKAVTGTAATIATSAGRCYRVTLVVRNGWGFVSSAAVSGSIRR